MMSLKFVRDPQGPWKTVVRGLWVWGQQAWGSYPRGTEVGMWEGPELQSCVLASLDSQESTEKARGGESGTLQSPGLRVGSVRTSLRVAPPSTTWSPTVASLLPVFNVALLLSLQWCLIGFFTLVSLMAGGGAPGVEHLSMCLLAMRIVSSSVKCLLKVFSSYPIGLLTFWLLIVRFLYLFWK